MKYISLYVLLCQYSQIWQVEVNVKMTFAYIYVCGKDIIVGMISSGT